MPAKLTKDRVNERIIDRGITLVGEYNGALTKAEFQCNCDYKWRATPNSIMTGNGCPLCYGNARLSKDIINERLQKSGRDIRQIGEYMNSGTKAEFQCNCGCKWMATPNSIMTGNGCPVCTTKMVADQKILAKETINSRIMDRGIGLVGEYTNSRIKTEFWCICGNIWKAWPNNIMSGQGCPVCSKKMGADKQRLSKEIVNSRIIDRGIELIGEYTNNGSKTDFRCKCGYIWKSQPCNIMTGSGCPKCADYGFNPGKSAWLYILIFAGYIKYGITNDLDRRLKEHLNNGEYTVAITKLYEDGAVAYNWERDIKIIFGGRYVTKEIMPNGWTETLSPDKLEALLDTIK